MKLEIRIEGDIVPTARARVVHGRAANPRTTVEYKAKIARATRVAVAAQGWAHLGTVCIAVVAHAPPPTSDVDNIAKSALDGLVAGGGLSDDNVKIVRLLTVAVVDAETPKLVIVVTPC